MIDPAELTEEEQNAADELGAQTLGCTAIFHVRWAAKMTEEDKLAVAEWLRHQATMLLSDGHQYAAIFSARYNPEE